MKQIIYSFLFCVLSFQAIGQACSCTDVGIGSMSAHGEGASSNASGTSGGFSGLSVSSGENGSENLRSLMSDYAKVKEEYSKIKGDPYTYGEKLKGSLVLNNGTRLENLLLSYDTFAGYIVYTNENDEEMLLDCQYFKEMTLEQNCRTIHFKKLSPDDPKTFHEILYESEDFSFFKNSYSRLIEGRGSGIKKIPARFSPKMNYYIKNAGHEIAKVKLKKKNILKHFPEAKAIAYREYINKNKIRLKEEQDYLDLFSSVEEIP